MSEVKYKICSKCGAQMQIEEGVMTSSIPPMYRYHCLVCGNLDFDTEMYPYTSASDFWADRKIVNDLSIHPYSDLTRDLYWQAFRAEAAKDILCAMHMRCGVPPGEVWKDCIKDAISVADQLIAKLKEDEKD